MLPIFGSGLAYLHAAGREDIDVRMLGKGRPFIIEFANPKNSISCHESIKDEILQSVMNTDLVYCHDFKIVTKEFFDSLKEIETSKAKSYSCVVWVKRRITPEDCEKLSSSVKDLPVQQTTPIRVLHRRSLAVRDKVIHRLRATYINQHYMHVCLLASAGTYIKEFVHGDLGRTVPSVGSLLDSEADILQLDVTNVYESLSDVINLPDSELFKIEVPDI
jgi:tRNA pseudouridine synthase 10